MSKDTWHEMRPFTEFGGVLAVFLSDGGTKRKRKVHHLVISAFVCARPQGLECRHLDGNNRNNCADNLAWGTHSENEADKHRHGTRQRGAKHHWSRLTEEQAIEAKRLLGLGVTQREIAQQIGISPGAIAQINLGHNWKHIP